MHITNKVQLDRIEPILWRDSAMHNDYEAIFDDQVFINHIQWIKNAAMFNKNENGDLTLEINRVINHINQALNS